MSRFKYEHNDDGSELRADLGDILSKLDADDRRLLWQALTIDVLGPVLAGDDDTLHVMFGRRADEQYRPTRSHGLRRPTSASSRPAR
jgi:hypothetical protein